MSARVLRACALVALVACGGEPFTIGDVDAGGDVAAALDAPAGDDTSADGGSVVDAGADTADGDPPLPESGAGDGPLCCDWIDAGKAHATACGASSWACFKDSGPGGHPCIDQPNDCRAGDPCILNDISHGYLRGEVRVCP